MLAVNAETPVPYMNHYESDASTLFNALCDALFGLDSMVQLTTDTIKKDESDIFYDFEDLADTDEIYTMTFCGEVDRQAIEVLGFEGWLAGPQQDTLGMLTGNGVYPAVSIEQEMPRTYCSFYACPLYHGQIPRTHSFHRVLRALKNL